MVATKGVVSRIYGLSLPGRDIKFSMEIDLSCATERAIEEYFVERNTSYEPDISNLMTRIIRPGDFVIDVGANVGFFSLLLSKLVGESGLVMSFECAPTVLSKLRYNLELNRTSNVRLIEAPLSSSVGEVDFFLCLDSDGGHALWDPGKFPANVKTAANPQVLHLKSMSLDSIKLPKQPILIKLDTEGSEHCILEGAQEVMKKFHPPFIVTELNPFGMRQMGTTSRMYREFMRSFGYNMFLLHPDGWPPTLVPDISDISFLNDIVVCNALFSTLNDVGLAYPRMPYL